MFDIRLIGGKSAIIEVESVERPGGYCMRCPACGGNFTSHSQVFGGELHSNIKDGDWGTICHDCGLVFTLEDYRWAYPEPPPSYDEFHAAETVDEPLPKDFKDLEYLF